MTTAMELAELAAGACECGAKKGVGAPQEKGLGLAVLGGTDADVIAISTAVGAVGGALVVRNNKWKGIAIGGLGGAVAGYLLQRTGLIG